LIYPVRKPFVLLVVPGGFKERIQHHRRH